MNRPPARLDLIERPGYQPPDGIAVDRPRLLRMLEQGLRRRVTLVSAPAGYGKSTLLHQCAAGSTRRSIVTVNGSSPSLIEFEAAPRGDKPDVVLLDEADPIRNPLTAATVSEVLRRLPPHARVIAARRAPWPSELPAAFGTVTRVDEHDIAFTRDEFETLIARVADVPITPEQVDALAERSGGWPAGALLASISLRSTDPAVVVEEFSGDDRHVAGYLDEEVLHDLDETDRLFLSVTAMLDVLTPSACDVITSDEKSAARLDDLHRRGVLSRRPHDDGYSCHPLLRELLWRRLSSSEPTDARRVAERTGQWCLDHGDPKAAMAVYAQVGLWEPVARIIHEHGRSMIEHGLDKRVVAVVRRAPAPFWEREREASMELAFLLTWMGDSRAAEVSVDYVARDNPTPGERAVIDVLRSSWIRRHASPAGVIRWADAAVDLLRSDGAIDPPDVFGTTPASELETFALCYRGVAHWHTGAVDAAREDLHAALARAEDFDLWLLRCHGDLAILEAWAGNLWVAEDHAARAFQLATEYGIGDHQCLIEAHLARARVARKRDQLDDVEPHVARARELASRHHELTAIVMCTIEEALLRLAQREPHRGLLALERDRRIADSAPSNRFTQLLDVVEASLRLAAGDRACAVDILRLGSAPFAVEARIVAVRTALAGRDRVTARELVDTWPVGSELNDILQRGIWSSVVEHLDGDRRSAAAQLGALLPHFTREGHVRILADSLPFSANLLRELNRAEPSELLDRVLASAITSVATDPDAGPTESLSERELGIIRYLPTRLSTVEIAGQLYISRNTLKTHLRSIYRKLGVSGRDAAVRRAEELGLA